MKKSKVVERRIYRFAIASGFLVALVIGCSTTMTGRKQLALMPDSQMNEMGVQAFAEMKKETKTDTRPDMVAYVRCIVDPIIEQIPAKNPIGKDANNPKTWEVVVFQDDTANAFALPGRKIGVHTGIIPVAKTPAQLAAVLGHEVSHVLLEHGNERVSQGVLTGAIVQGADMALGSTGSTQHAAIMGGLGLGAQVGVLLPFSRKHESEADLFGQMLMAKAGFDPAEAVDLWVNMSKGGGAPPEFLSTHPSGSTRIDQLKKNLPKVEKDYEAAKAAGRKPKCTVPSMPAKAAAAKSDTKS